MEQHKNVYISSHCRVLIRMHTPNTNGQHFITLVRQFITYCVLDRALYTKSNNQKVTKIMTATRLYVFLQKNIQPRTAMHVLAKLHSLLLY